MTRVHIVSDDFGSSNGRAFLYPILQHRRRLKDLGLSICVFSAFAPDIGNCDTLAIDGKAVRNLWGEKTEDTLEQLHRLRETTSRIYFFDTTDSAGFLVGEVISHVDKYFKNQLLVDREAYTRPMYGRRTYTDFYHRKFGVIDTEPMSEPQVDNPDDLQRLHVSWNAGLANYDAYGHYLAMAYQKVRLPILLRRPRGFVAADAKRDIAIHTRMGLNYHRETIAWQRQQISQRLADKTDWQRVDRREYMRELGRSRLVLAPFGWGEFTYKDYETFITGGLLIKPDMSHMVTWPDFYRVDETMLVHRWDLSDLDDTIERGLAAPEVSVEMAQRAQDFYRNLVTTPNGRDTICERIVSCLT